MNLGLNGLNQRSQLPTKGNIYSTKNERWRAQDWCKLVVMRLMKQEAGPVWGGGGHVQSRGSQHLKKRSGKRSANKVLLSLKRSKFKCQTTASEKCMMGDWVCEIPMKIRCMHDHSPLNFLWSFMVLRSASSVMVPDVSCQLYISDLSFSINLHLFLILDMEGAGHQSTRGF